MLPFMENQRWVIDLNGISAMRRTSTATSRCRPGW